MISQEYRYEPPEDPHTRSFVASIRASGVDVGALVDRLKVDEVDEEMVIGYIEILRDRDSDAEKRIEYLKKITDNSYQLDKLLGLTSICLWKGVDRPLLIHHAFDESFQLFIRLMEDVTVIYQEGSESFLEKVEELLVSHEE